MQAIQVLFIVLLTFGYSQQADKSVNKINHRLLPSQGNSVNREFIKAIETLVHRALKYYYQTCYIISAVDDEKDEYFINIKTELLTALNKQYGVRLETMKFDNSIVRKVRQNSIFLIDDIENFQIIEKSIVPERYRMSGNFLFVLVDGYFDEMQEIYDTLWKKSIYSCYVIYEYGSDIILNTFNPFENPSNCGSTKPKIISKFIDGKFDQKVMLTRKLENLNECPIRMIAYLDPTYVSMIKYKNSSYELYGRGINFINVLSSTLNFTKEITLAKGELPWGVVYENGTCTGNFDDLKRNIYDMALGEFYMTAVRSKYFDNSITHYTTPMVFIIPPGRPYKAIEKMLQPFDHVVWIILLITIMTAITIIYVVNTRFKNLKSFIYGRGVKSPIMNILVGLFGLQQTVLPGRNFARYILMKFLILCLVLRSIYQGSLYQFLQSDKRHREIQSVDEMIKKDFTFLMYESGADILRNNTEIISRKKLQNTTKNSMLYTRLNGNEKIAALESLISIEAEIYNGSHIKYCKESVVTFSIVFYYRKHFYLREEIDRKIDSLLSAGIIDHWIKSSYKYYGYRNLKDLSPRKLTLDDLLGPFCALLIFHASALIIFVMEVIISRNKTLILKKLGINEPKIFLKELKLR
ncbi:ionotropic receptor 21a-like [Chironomus tepperi]|uniref:ionotropic receptor 21a-like n=1 Tax=Chironomus tepperi TaxID=113505 RepID=UPI00391F74DD